MPSFLGPCVRPKKPLLYIKKTMSHCKKLPQCSPYKDLCRKPNAWLIFMMAHSRANQSDGNSKLLNKTWSLKKKVKTYWKCVEQDLPLCVDAHGFMIHASSNSSLCRMYRQLKNIQVVQIPVIRESTLPSFRIEDLEETYEMTTWAEGAVKPDRPTPAQFNRSYGFEHQKARVYTDGRPSRVSGPVVSAARITLSTVKYLREGRWLNDDIINGFMSLMWSYCNKRKVIVYSSTDFGQGRYNINRFTDTQRIALYEAAKTSCGLTSEPKLTVIPYNIENVHWILLTYDHVLNIWHSFDSFNSDQYAVASSYHDSLMSMMGFDEPPPFRYKQQMMPQQRDGYQCGVWTCMAGLCAVLGRRLPAEAFKKGQASDYSAKARLFIAKTMYSNSITLTKDPQENLRPEKWNEP